MDFNAFEENTKAKSASNVTTDHIDLLIGHYGFEHTQADKGYVSSFDYPTFRLHFILKGQLNLFVCGNPIPVRKHQLFLLQPDIDMGFITDPEDPAVFYWISFSGNKSREYAEKMGFGDKTPCIGVPARYVNKLRDAFYKNFTVPAGCEDLTDIIFNEHFMQIARLAALSARSVRQNTETQKKHKKKYVELALEYINGHYSDPDLSIAEVAKSLFLHENYLSKIFKGAMGLTFGSYLTQKRIEAAVMLIKQGFSSVGEIAARVGYADPLYFSKVYKKYNKISPSADIRKYAPR